MYFQPIKCKKAKHTIKVNITADTLKIKDSDKSSGNVADINSLLQALNAQNHLLSQQARDKTASRGMSVK